MNTIMKPLLHGIMILVQVACALILLAVSLFCVFGVLASFEPGNGWEWKAGYEFLGCSFLSGAVTLFLRLFLPKLKATIPIVISVGLFFLLVLLLRLTAMLHLL